MWILYAFLSAFFAALVAITAKIGLERLDATLATTIRAIIMAGFFIVASVALKKFNGFSLAELSSKEGVFIVISGLVGALSWLFYFWALKAGNASQVAAIDRLSIVFVVVIAGLLLGESLGWKALLGASLMALGAILISLK